MDRRLYPQRDHTLLLNLVSVCHANLTPTDVTIQKLKRSYVDSRSAQMNLSKLGEDLQDVQRIMMQNIDEVLGRGEKIDSMGSVMLLTPAALSSKAGNLSMHSKAYLKVCVCVHCWTDVAGCKEAELDGTDAHDHARRGRVLCCTVCSLHSLLLIGSSYAFDKYLYFVVVLSISKITRIGKFLNDKFKLYQPVLYLK